MDSLVGEGGVILEDVPADGVGKVEVRGIVLERAQRLRPSTKGQRCRVDRVDGLTLWVRPE